MKLIYFDRSFGNNFGDLLNEVIFEHYLPGLFDECDQVGFIGIGSILGLPFAIAPDRKFVFSSGFAYGQVPRIDNSYKILCVRGPYTAKVIGVEPEAAIADGAYLLHGMELPKPAKKHKCSIMLHWTNVEKFNWREISRAAGINFIDPSADVDFILRQISESELVLAEAMHAAIAADALRVPWLPICCYRGINTFKWRDFTAAMELSYEPVTVWPLYANNSYVRDVIVKKTRGWMDIRKMPVSLFFRSYEAIQRRFLEEQVTESLVFLSDKEGMLSLDSVVVDRFERLLGILRGFERIHR